MPALITRLGLYNDALTLHLGERRLADLTEATEARRILDAAWDRSGQTDGGPIHCLELGFWNFYTIAAALNFEVTPPAFGFQRAFNKPTGWLRTVAISDDPYFNHRLEHYRDQGAQWYADCDVLYVKYISEVQGMDLTLWTMSFAEFVSLYLADHGSRIAKSADRRREIRQLWEAAKKKANNIDGMNKPTVIRQMGQWASSRLGGSFSRFREGNG
jgi:hypothetical protein